MNTITTLKIAAASILLAATATACGTATAGEDARDPLPKGQPEQTVEPRIYPPTDIPEYEVPPRIYPPEDVPVFDPAP